MVITARYVGTCSVCGGKISVGARINWDKATRRVSHVKCPASRATATPAERPAAEGSIRLSGGSGYGCTGWTVGQVILSGEKRRREGGPAGLVILTASRRYVREDGLSFGVGDDRGYLYYATARAATAEELAPAIEQAHVEALRDARDREAKAVRAEFESAPWIPEEEADRLAALPGAETVLLDPGVNGGRLWVVVEAERLTMICGGYYDDYRRSGHSLPRTADLERRVRALAVQQ